MTQGAGAPATLTTRRAALTDYPNPPWPDFLTSHLLHEGNNCPFIHSDIRILYIAVLYNIPCIRNNRHIHLAALSWPTNTDTCTALGLVFIPQCLMHGMMTGTRLLM